MTGDDAGAPDRRYHHGDLRRALVDAGVELARPDGPDAVLLRGAGRRAGVSHNAAYRHFADRDALLRAVAEDCMGRLALLIEQRVAAVPSAGDPRMTALERVRACGQAYLEFALTEPGWFRTAFAVPRSLDHFGDGQGAGVTGLNPYELLNAGLDELVTAGAIPADRRAGAEVALWSLIHGLSTLLIDGPLRDAGAVEREAAIAHVFEFAVRGLLTAPGRWP